MRRYPRSHILDRRPALSVPAPAHDTRMTPLINALLEDSLRR